MANSIFPFVWPTHDREVRTREVRPRWTSTSLRLDGSFIKRVTLTRTAAQGLRNGALPRAVESRAIDACWHTATIGSKPQSVSTSGRCAPSRARGFHLFRSVTRRAKAARCCHSYEHRRNRLHHLGVVFGPELSAKAAA